MTDTFRLTAAILETLTSSTVNTLLVGILVGVGLASWWQTRVLAPGRDRTPKGPHWGVRAPSALSAPAPRARRAPCAPGRGRPGPPTARASTSSSACAAHDRVAQGLEQPCKARTDRTCPCSPRAVPQTEVVSDQCCTLQR